MARPLNKLEIEKRIKASAAIMKASKRIVLESVSASSDKFIPAPLAREALSNYIKAQKAFNQDSLKLNLIEVNN